MTPERRCEQTPEHPRRRRQDLESLVTQLAGLLNEERSAFRRYRKRATAMFVILTAASTIGAAWVWSITRDIQDERYRNTYQACESTNERNVETKMQLRSLVDAIPPGPRRERAEASQASTELLIDALVPYTPDCKAFAEERVQVQVD